MLLVGNCSVRPISGQTVKASPQIVGHLHLKDAHFDRGMVFIFKKYGFTRQCNLGRDADESK